MHSRSSNRICGVMVSMPPSSVVDRKLEYRSGQTNHYIIGICCFSATLTSKSKCLQQNDVNIPCEISFHTPKAEAKELTGKWRLGQALVVDRKVGCKLWRWTRKWRGQALVVDQKVEDKL